MHGNQPIWRAVAVYGTKVKNSAGESRLRELQLYNLIVSHQVNVVRLTCDGTVLALPTGRWWQFTFQNTAFEVRYRWERQT